MRILETGEDSGFTLLEVLVIIVLLAVVVTMTYAGLTAGAEKAEVYLIGELAAGDLRHVRDEALFNQQDTVLEFFSDGYRYKIGSVEINRSFKKFQFAFTIPEPVKETMAGEGLADEISGIANEVNTGNNGSRESEEPAGESQSKSLEIKFGADGKTDGIKMDWQTSHFKGDLTISQEGTVNWRYERK